jgi:DNA-binding response OmpR family regulator
MAYQTAPEKVLSETVVSPEEQTGLDLDKIAESPARQRVMIVDDDSDTVFLLKEILRRNGYDVVGALSGREALRKCSEFSPDVVLLDLMMPEMDGWETYRQMRQMTTAPVIVVTAKSHKEDVVFGLNSGIDDYITKPFYNAEVIARVGVVLRRYRSPKQAQRLAFPEVGLVLDLKEQEVSLHGRPCHLSGREFQVLAVLARSAGEVVRHSVIAKEVWGNDTPEVRKQIKYLIYLLRRKLEVDPGRPTMILNSGGVGYKLLITHRN